MDFLSHVPTLPVAFFAAIFFRNKFKVFAWILPIIAEIIHYSVTTWSPVFFFTVAALLCAVAITQRITSFKGFSLPILALCAVISVVNFWFVSDFGVWFIGSCIPRQNYGYTANFQGLLLCWEAGLPFLFRSLAVNVPSGVIFMLVALRFAPKTQAEQKTAFVS